MKTVLIQRYDNKQDILAIEARGYSDVYQRSRQEDFDLVAIVPTLKACTDTVIVARPTSQQYTPPPNSDDPWPGRPDTYPVRIDLTQIRYTTLARIKEAVKAAGASWSGAWTIRVLELDEQLFLLPEDLAQLEDEEEATILQAATTGSGLYEGADMRILVNRYERNAKARQACLAHYGHTCFGCGFNFQQFYGSLAAGYIHVHHLRPLSQLKARYQVDPIQDLRPVCANCHAVLHLRTPPYSIEELQAAITTTTYLAN